MTFPLWFTRWVARHAPRFETEADLMRWWDGAGPILVRGTVLGLEKSRWRIVRFDTSTEPGERPIVIDELTSEGFRGVH
jgi:hypothetical protein